MAGIQQPSGQIKLTNVALVRLKKGRKRFEIACYQNKVQDWRKGVETDLDEVLQIPQVFVNVGKGQTAPGADMKAAFGHTDQDKIILEILNTGELQLGEKERQQQSSQLQTEIIQLVSQKCVNSKTKRPYTATMIEKALIGELKFNIVPKKSAKIQALDAIKLLVEKQLIPIARARMRIRVTGDVKKLGLGEKLKTNMDATVEEESHDELVCSIDPGQFRPVNEFVLAEGKGKCKVEVMEVAVQN